MNKSSLPSVYSRSSQYTQHKVDTLLRQALRYCAMAGGQTWWVEAETRPEPRRLPRRWPDLQVDRVIADVIEAPFAESGDQAIDSGS